VVITENVRARMLRGQTTLEGNQMTKEQALKLIRAEWLQLPLSERTNSNSTGFSMEMAYQRSELWFDTDGDRYQDIKAFLNNYLTGSSSGHIDFTPASNRIM
jgi:hypothetical protein